MKLLSFRIKNYRSVNDSGVIEGGDCVALVGRNESGKTNLLLALESLNPPDREIQKLSFVKDFPRDRAKTDFSEDLEVVETTWELTEQERKQLAEIFPRSKDTTKVSISRKYRDTRYVGFEPLLPLQVERESIEQAFTKIRQSISGCLSKQSEPVKKAIADAVEKLCVPPPESKSQLVEWATTLLREIKGFRSLLPRHSVEMPEVAGQHMDRLAELAENLSQDEERHAAARQWAVKNMPVFIYLADYPELHGHQDMPDLIRALDGQRQQTEADRNFLRLCKVAGLDPRQMNELLSGSHEERQQLANRAGAVVTRKIRELWKDRQLMIRFNLDGKHFDTLVSDPTSVYPVEINFDDRSRGFKWFFSFYVAFAADTSGGPAENAILLLDEPGLYLHAVAQRDLLDHFDQDFRNQVIYTTHSPFMIPIHHLSRVRTVNVTEERGTVVTNDVQGDSKTLFPLQTALGYDLTQALFIGEKNLVVEGVTDFWYLASISDYLKEKHERGLPDDLIITPAGGAQKIPYMVALLTAQNLKVLVLLDEEPGARQSHLEMIRNKLIRGDNVICITEGYDSPRGHGADIEDLLDPATYSKLVKDTYSAELQGKTPQVNDDIPRIVRRYEDAFVKLGLKFNKTRPARQFIHQISSKPESIVTELTKKRFARLFGVVTERLAKQAARSERPFI